MYNELAWPLQCARRDGEAEALYKKGLELDPSFPHTYILLSGIYLSRGQPQEAISAAEKSAYLVPALKVVQANLSFIYGMAGRRDEARKILEGLERRLQSEYVSPVDRGAIYWTLGEEEKAMDLLEEGFEEGDFRMVLLKVAFNYDPLRSKPAFPGSSPPDELPELTLSNCSVLIGIEVDDRIIGIERLIFFGQLLELPEEVTIGHSQIMLGPGDHPREWPPLAQPAIGDVDRRLVVRHKDSAELSRFLEVEVIGSPFGE